MADIAGIDSGLTLKDRTSGVCRTGANGFVVGHTYIDKLSRANLLAPVQQFDCLGIDAPVLPKNVLHYNSRPIESLFMRGAYQTRCKPGASHVVGTGQALRRSGCDTAIQFAAETLAQSAVPYPRVQADQNVVEAFPNAFLGVMLDQQVELLLRAVSRGDKTDTFSLSAATSWRDPGVAQQHLGWSRRGLLGLRSPTTTDHDELAALVCGPRPFAHHGKIRGCRRSARESISSCRRGRYGNTGRDSRLRLSGKQRISTASSACGLMEPRMRRMPSCLDGAAVYHGCQC